MRRRLFEAVMADWQFERGTALARGDRWGARLATVRATAALVRIAGYWVVRAPRDAFAGDAAQRLAGLAAIATVLATIPVWMMPLIALATGGYQMFVSAMNVALLLVYLSPTALVVTIPIGLSTGVLAACPRPSDARRIRVAVVLLVIVATLTSSVLMLRLAPAASRAFRELAMPVGGELRVNRPGSIGYHFEQSEGFALLCANAVLAGFAFSAAAAATPRRRWPRLSAGLASVGYPFLYLPAGVLAFSGVVPPSLAVWLPNMLFVTMTIFLIAFSWTRRPRQHERPRGVDTHYRA